MEIPVDRDKKFEDAVLPKLNPEKISLELDADLNLIKKNATKNFTQKGIFNPILNDPKLNKLLDALVLDSFWFIVTYIQSHNIQSKSKSEEKRKEVYEILKRISSNYFRFFINLCDNESSIVKKKDPVLNLFKDFIAQCGDPTGTGEGGESIYGAPFKVNTFFNQNFIKCDIIYIK